MPLVAARAAAGMALVAVAAGPAPAGAQAAALTLDRGCYLARQPALPAGQAIVVRGEGFTPEAPVAFRLGGASLGSLNANAAGALAGRFTAPTLAAGQFKATRTLTASDGSNQASVPISLRRLAAHFVPTLGDPRTLRVTFYVYGFGPVLTQLGRPTGQPVYMHVFRPNGRRKASLAVGRTRGPCGDMKSTRRRILPYRIESGRWRFVFTTAPRYSSHSTPSASVGFLVRQVPAR
jgi:hypothetical protein